MKSVGVEKKVRPCKNFATSRENFATSRKKKVLIFFEGGKREG